MAIRRISDLENLQSGEQEQAQLSDCLFEVSYPHAENQYRSYSTTGAELV